MGGIKKIFGGSTSAPKLVVSEPVPVRETEVEPESTRVRNEERRKIRQRRGMSGTLLTSALGTTTEAQGQAATLLGRKGV